MREKTALEEAIAFASLRLPEAIDAEEYELRSYKGKVAIKGIRLFAKRGWPDLVQVLIGKRWITVIRGTQPSIGSNFGITARAIKHRARTSGLAQKR